MGQSDIGLIGLAVMGENLVMNLERHGFTVSVYNRTSSKVDRFLAGRAKGKNITGAYSIRELAGQLKKPRIIMLMVRAGDAVDSLISQLIPCLEKGDVIVDGGNSRYTDTQRRCEYVEGQGLYYIGMGVSGGEEGALNGPSLMPGGSEAAWPVVKPLFQAISAKVADGSPCCEWVGSGGAGHFVKMVHNGIEYGDMEIICEAYHIMRSLLHMEPGKIADVFGRWNEGRLNSYLIEITAQILRFRDADGSPLIDRILDTAGQKGTGKWTVQTSLEENVPLTLIYEAVSERYLSAMKEERVKASGILPGVHTVFNGDAEAFTDDIRDALYASKLVSYAQGYSLMRQASSKYGWNLNFGGIALLWRGGCIIRSAFLEEIQKAFRRNPLLSNLLLDDYFRDEIAAAQPGWRRVCAEAALSGITTPALSSALSYYDGYRSASLPANLLQAQRDYFGAHTYERTDRERGEFFHTNWTGKGGDTAASEYRV